MNKLQAHPVRQLRIPTHLIAVLVAAALLGAGIEALSPAPSILGWWVASFLLALCFFVLLAAWRWAGGRRSLAWMIALAFLLRLGIGISLSQMLPVWGYADEQVQQAGYLFKDAYERDLRAWDLAQSDSPLWASFRDEFATDQYGGLLALSAGVYRILSPEAQRPYLILILGAFVAALGLPFFYRAVRLRWPARVAAIAAWIYVLYPDAIFFGSSQMREPFLVGLSAVAFWSVLTLKLRRPVTWLALLGSLLAMALFSSRVAAAAGAFLGLLFLLEYVTSRPERVWRVLGGIGLGLGVLVLIGFSWDWFRSSTAWDIKVTEGDSGMVSYAIDKASARIGISSEYLRYPFITAYGLARPVLPAAVAQTSIPLWRTVGIIRSVGWYALAPFLLYALFTVWREPDPQRRWRAIWLALTVMLWLIVASARGGGDATDNPRYRSLFVIWLALLAAWAVDWALAHHDAWLWRWLAVEVIFLGFFTSWYLSRYYKVWVHMSFWSVVTWVALLSGAVLGGGWLWDHRQRQKLPRRRDAA